MFIVEDNESDVYLIRKALEATMLPLTFQVARDGEQAVRFFDQLDADPGEPSPELVLLDINLPQKTGHDVLKHIRESTRCAKVRVIVVSTSSSPRDRERMRVLGADGYFHKPSDFDEFMKLGDLVKRFLSPQPR